MKIQKLRTSGYVCSPYLHDHNSIEQKDLWMASKNIGDMYFVTATFSENSQPYFSYATNHYILAQFKNHHSFLKLMICFLKDKLLGNQILFQSTI